jgi:hypothetical protein
MEGSRFARYRRMSRSLQHQLSRFSSLVSYRTIASRGASAVRGSPHRVLGINELLEKILRDLAPSAQYAAWNVSISGTHNTKLISSPYPCPPVEHGQVIQANLQRLQPSQDEIGHLEETVDRFS